MARRGATGYEVGDVDTFIDKVEESFAQFENERDLLRREVEAARTTGDSAPCGQRRGAGGQGPRDNLAPY